MHQHSTGPFDLLLGERLVVNTHGLLGYAVMNSTYLRQELIERDIGVRTSMALQYLKIRHMSVEEIACSLGYTDMTNLRSAFKRWQKRSLSTYRAEQQT